jgi:transcriptional regulator with XRE-family HTH domain
MLNEVARGWMATVDGEPVSFRVALTRFRAGSGLTQEELAERAGLSVEAVGALERGVRSRPRASTVNRLAEALALSPDDRASFEQAALSQDLVGAGVDTLPVGEFLGAMPPRELVAREEECERLRAILTAVADGLGHVVLLSGEAGIGKTRLLQELMVEARAAGHVVLTGRCSISMHPVPYYPMLDALGGLATSPPARTGQPPGGEVGRLWKHIQRMVDGDGITGGQARSGVIAQEVMDAVTGLLLLAARSAPITLLLDDLQWADAGSLVLVQHLARSTRSARVLIVGACRDGQLLERHPDLAKMLHALSKERLAERVTVRRLSLEETSRLVAATMSDGSVMNPVVSEEFAAFV